MSIASVGDVAPAVIAKHAACHPVALDFSPDEDDEDVVDARDFLLGSDDGGLVLRLPGGGVGRAPYVLPYVDPFARASISASRELSIAVWALNAHAFEPTQLRVRDLPRATRATLPLPDAMKLNEACAWHIERLRRSAPP